MRDNRPIRVRNVLLEPRLPRDAVFNHTYDGHLVVQQHVEYHFQKWVSGPSP